MQRSLKNSNVMWFNHRDLTNKDMVCKTFCQIKYQAWWNHGTHCSFRSNMDYV